ncbi:MAG: hypothetical protein ACYSWU_19735 [Planctomycetota bacterium]|jgi:hypothetical protein
MATVALTVYGIINGDGGDRDMTNWGVAPTLGAVNATAGVPADNNSFVNPADRRTLLIVKNASGSYGIQPIIVAPTIFGAGGGMPIQTMSQGESPDSPYGTSTRVPLGLCDDGETRVYGPFIHPWMGNPVVIEWRRDTDDALEGTGITAGVFYLPWTDDIAGLTGDSDEDATWPVAASASLITVETITPNGLLPTFTDFNTAPGANGFGLALRNDSKSFNGRRRFMWLRNNSGDNLSYVIAGGNRSGPASPLWPLVSSNSGTMRLQGGWFIPLIDDGEEFLVGPYDERLWCIGGNLFGVDMTDSLSIRMVSSGGYTAGTTAGVDIAWMGLDL